MACSMVKKGKRRNNRESHPGLLFLSMFQVRAALLPKTSLFIQICDSMCRLYLHGKMDESDNTTAYQEVLHDAMFP